MGVLEQPGKAESKEEQKHTENNYNPYKLPSHKYTHTQAHRLCDSRRARTGVQDEVGRTSIDRERGARTNKD